jgi:hypothetical protein
LASKLVKNIKNLSDTQAINDFIKEVKNAKNIINDLSAEQKVVAKMIGDDVDELKKFIAGDLRKQPGG